ncbi:hypothetical protein DV711_09280 [Motiliproteus coralliicola]|uniref:DedA family protein n=2 Tax=Motiliproteus coralliicola TaxID=2283196 RepID=A0A369WL06_9GAMM|nr:hypothetical protein DV711_09280 [Motiliproteus coralliicola]
MVRFLKLLLFVGVVLLINFGAAWLARQIDFQIFPRHESLLQGAVLSMALLYVLLMAIPFMPGIEVGLGLMLLLGGKGALLVYLCTLLSLSISFSMGRLLSPLVLCRFLSWFHFSRASNLIQRLAPLDAHARMKLLNEKAPSRIAPILVKHRFLTIAVLLNLPGNAVIGGGGGIGLIVGMSHLVSYPTYLMLLVLAVAPVPLWFWFQGG